ENFVEANAVTVVDVTVLRENDVPVDFVVRQHRLRLPQIPRETGRPQDRAGNRTFEALLGGDLADADSAFAPDRVAGKQLVVFGNTALDDIEHFEDARLPTVGKVGGDTTRADVVAVHPQSGNELEQPQDFFALAPAVEHHRHRADVHAVRGLEQQVR